MQRKIILNHVWFSLGLSVAFIVIYWQFPAYRYEQQSSLFQNVFSCLLAQFSHLDWQHTIINMIGFWLLTWGFQKHIHPITWVYWIGLHALGTATFIALNHTIGWYCGASGWLHGLLVCSIMTVKISCRLKGIVLLGLVIKLMIDWRSNDPQTLAIAHVYGSVVGLILGSIYLMIRKRPSLENVRVNDDVPK